jgi:hypothetical protein
MELMETIDPIAFEVWIGENFIDGGALNGGSASIDLQQLIANAVMDPQVTILSQAVSQTGIDETHARMTIALIQGFLKTQGHGNGKFYV